MSIWKPADKMILLFSCHDYPLWHSRMCKSRRCKRVHGVVSSTKYHDYANTLGSKYVKPDLAIARGFLRRSARVVETYYQFSGPKLGPIHIHGALRCPIHVRVLNR
jgi:hypothetical protein